MPKYAVAVEAKLTSFREMELVVEAVNEDVAVDMVKARVDADEIDIDDMSDAGWHDPEIYLSQDNPGHPEGYSVHEVETNLTLIRRGPPNGKLYLHHVTGTVFGSYEIVYVWASGPDEAARVFLEFYGVQSPDDVGERIVVTPMPTRVPKKAVGLPLREVRGIEINPRELDYSGIKPTGEGALVKRIRDLEREKAKKK